MASNLKILIRKGGSFMKKALMFLYGEYKGAYWLLGLLVWAITLLLWMILTMIFGDMRYPDAWLPTVSAIIFIVVLPIAVRLMGRKFIERADGYHYKVLEIDPDIECEIITFGDHLWKKDNRRYAQVKDDIEQDGEFYIDIQFENTIAKIPIYLSVERNKNKEKDIDYYQELHMMGDPWEFLQKKIKVTFSQSEEKIRDLIKEYFTQDVGDNIFGAIQKQITQILSVSNPYSIADAEIEIRPIVIKNLLPSEKQH